MDIVYNTLCMRTIMGQKELNQQDFWRYVREHGIVSFCTSDETVVYCALKTAKRRGGYVLLEATSNQVNPDGGYTGKTSAEYRDWIENLAKSVDFDCNYLVLGGDHIGPLPWKHLPASKAMRKAEQLISNCVQAGFQKIHIDTTVLLGGDTKPLSEEVIVNRWMQLYDVAMQTALKMKRRDPEFSLPVFIIGNEVPTAGGEVGLETSPHVTSEETLCSSIELYRQKLIEAGYPDAFEHISGVVADFGIDFGGDGCWPYQKGTAIPLVRILDQVPGMVLEAHATDYQSEKSIREMWADGIRIFKIGPELTYAKREALFRLSEIEARSVPEAEQTHFPEILEQAMLANPAYWSEWYTGTREEQRYQRIHSKLNRDRYYMNQPMVRAAEQKLIANLKRTGIPTDLRSLEESEDPMQMMAEKIQTVINRYMGGCR